jgi:hypothetical protein
MGILVGALGCASEPAEPGASCTDAPCLEPPARGFQLRSEGSPIAPGEDVEYCEVAQIPGDPTETFHVTRIEVAMTTFSHHLILAAAAPDSETEAQMKVGERVPCVGPGGFGLDLLPVTASQHPYHDERYPTGVGRAYRGGSKVVFNYHYFNTSSAPIHARAAVNFHTAPARAIERLARDFAFVNFGIELPPGQQASFTTECAFSHDVEVFKLIRHTHRWGGDFDVWLSGGERDGEHVWTSPDYETTDLLLDTPFRLRAGEGFRFRCAFDNPTASTVVFGEKATDEMCILAGGWLEPAGTEVPEQFCLQF